MPAYRHQLFEHRLLSALCSSRFLLSAVLVILLLSLSACFYVFPSEGGGQIPLDSALPRPVDSSDILLPPGYKIEAVATGLTFPTSVTFDEAGTPYVVEAGYSYGEVFTTPKILRIGADGTKETVVAGENPPWTGATYHSGSFYVAEGGHLGRIVRYRPSDQTSTVLAEGLPSFGDHHTNGVLLSNDGWLYFSQGTATNSAVVGVDNAKMGWLHRYPLFHDVPCRDVTLTGENFLTKNPLDTGNSAGKEVRTGAFLPFGVSSTPGQVIPGRIPCSGSLLRMRADGGPLELIAWGFRNPFGLAFSERGTIYVSDNGYDVRGSRPVFGAPDLLWEVDPNAQSIWHGWPEFSGHHKISRKRFAPPGKPTPPRLLAEYPGHPPKPHVKLGVHSSSNGIAVDSSGFSSEGAIFVAQFGDMAPMVGKVLSPVGYKVVRVDRQSGAVTDFAANKGDAIGPASWAGNGGLERPIDVEFSPNGGSLYVVDFGVMVIGNKGPIPLERTGVLWRITPAS